MAPTVTPVLAPQPTLPFFPGVIPDLRYDPIATRPTIDAVTVAMRVVTQIKSPCIGAGKGCQCPCCAPKGGARPTFTRRKHCTCYNYKAIWLLRPGEKSPRELHGCDCVEEETHEMSAWEALMYHEFADESGNVVIDC